MMDFLAAVVANVAVLLLERLVVYLARTVFVGTLDRQVCTA
ncbi:MAG TPA: hypothetical protein VGJ13_10585 [Pseudonocardiaceae bacterium]|jgi:hypothetical protein